MHHAKYPIELCDENYIGEDVVLYSGRHIAEKVKDHNGRDHKLHILKHHLKLDTDM